MSRRLWILGAPLLALLLALVVPAWAAVAKPKPSPKPDDGARNPAHYERLRSYPGAPPVYVHEIEGDFDLDRQTCLACHEDGTGGAPITPHPGQSECRQCHVGAKASSVFKPTAWVKVSRPKKLEPALRGAPPPIPHELNALRSKCVACHSGPAALAGIRTPHPERANCLQCHVPAQARGIWSRD